MEAKYKVRIALTVMLFTGGPLFYGFTDPSDDARFTLAAALSIPLILLWVVALGLIGTGIERGARFLLKR